MSPLIGHESKWNALSRAFERGTIAQTLLISGAARVGKTTLATRYAQLLLCPNTARRDDILEPCGQCAACHQIEIETYPDFRVLRPAVKSEEKAADEIVAPEELSSSIISIYAARRFRKEAWMKPQIGARKVMLIHQADRLTIEAQNALLKTWEEPIDGLTILLLTENPSALLPTVLSRCWEMKLGLVPAARIASWLQQRLSTQDFAPQTFDEAVRIADGRPGAAWREMERTRWKNAGDDTPVTWPQNATRYAQTAALVQRVMGAPPFASLALSEAAQALAQQWWDEDRALDAFLEAQARGEAKTKGESKKSALKETRSALAHFLDELARVYRGQWMQSEMLSTQGEAFARGLDLIRKTRHYILRNVNSALALDVMFAQLIELHRPRERNRPSRADVVKSRSS